MAYNNNFWQNIPPVTRNLLLVNVIMFVATLINEEFMVGTFAMFYPASPFFRWWQPLTHMFMHGGWWHIFFNMYSSILDWNIQTLIYCGRKSGICQSNTCPDVFSCHPSDFFLCGKLKIFDLPVCTCIPEVFLCIFRGIGSNYNKLCLAFLYCFFYHVFTAHQSTGLLSKSNV